MLRKICFGAIDTHTHTRTFSKRESQFNLPEAKNGMRNEFNFAKTKFLKNHNKNDEIWRFCGIFGNILRIPQKIREIHGILGEVRGKSVEVRGKPTKCTWKSVESPWKSVGSPWKSKGNPWKSMEPTFGFFGPNLGILVRFGCFCVFWGVLGVFFVFFGRSG